MDRRGFLRRAPAAALAAGATVAGVASIEAPVAAEPAVEYVDRVVDRKVADVTFRAVVLPEKRRGKRRTKQEIAEAKQLVEQQKLYQRMTDFTPEQIAAAWNELNRAGTGGEVLPVGFSIISYNIARRARKLGDLSP